MSPEQNRPGERGPRRIVDYLGGPWVWIFVALFAVVALSVRFAVQPSTSTTAEDVATTTTASTTPAEPSSTMTPTTVAPPTSTPSDTVAAPDDTASLENSGVWTMPDEIGNVLSSAKDDIETLTDGTSVEVAVSDASGEGRRQIIHQNWQVCSQTPAAGQKFTPESGVSFTVVKIDETCPDNGA
ncbi:MAG TPA: hypothetical protein VFN21_06735 [Acidimicrobiales bacterium]|nr:hypothetical protein [Acidimicrobiales bacterium]